MFLFLKILTYMCRFMGLCHNCGTKLWGWKIQFSSDQISVGSTWTNSLPKVKPLVISPFSIFFLKFRLSDAKTHENFSGKRKQNIEHCYEGGMESEKRQPHKMVKQTQTIRRLLPTNCLSVFDHIVGLPLKGLTGEPYLVLCMLSNRAKKWKRT